MVDITCDVKVRSLFGEAPVWSAPTATLYWIDCLKPMGHRYDPASGIDVELPLPGPRLLQGLVERAQRGLVLIADDGVYAVDPEDCVPQLLTPQGGNDGKCDRQGRLWFGSGDNGGVLFRLDPDLSLHAVDGGFQLPNGPAFTGDGRRMYLADTAIGVIYVYDFVPETGDVKNRRVFARVPSADGAPDGMTVDADGYLWSALCDGGRLVRFAPDGRVDRVVRLPVAKTTSCCFGGPGLRRLYVTTASGEWDASRSIEPTPTFAGPDPTPGGVFGFHPGVAGLEDTPFAG